MDTERIEQLNHLLNHLDIAEAHQPELFNRALTHSSYTYENKLSPLDNYERLEFLGDAVLKLVVSEYLFERFSDYREGELTKIRAVVVSDAVLSDLARNINLGDYMIFGVSEGRNRGALKSSNLACGFEALLGALFLDGKMNDARNLLVKLLQDVITDVDLSKTKDNYKAVLQEMTQADDGSLPHYQTVKESGPSHNRTFTIEVTINHEVVGVGLGKSKKEAQQSAAKKALLAFGIIDEDDLESTVSIQEMQELPNEYE